MIHVRKGPPPPALVTFQQTPDTSVDPPRRARYEGPGFDKVKPEVREALYAEQRGLCCYCNGAIQPTAAAMKIEHRVPQHGEHGDPARDLDWTNLFGACLGRTTPRAGREALHCDASKGDAALSFDPSNVSHVATVGYQGARLTSSRAEFQREFDEVLRLNDAPARRGAARSTRCKPSSRGVTPTSASPPTSSGGFVSRRGLPRRCAFDPMRDSSRRGSTCGSVSSRGAELPPHPNACA